MAEENEKIIICAAPGFKLEISKARIVLQEKLGKKENQQEFIVKAVKERVERLSNEMAD